MLREREKNKTGFILLWLLILTNGSHALCRFMVGCGRCDDWFHGDCVGLDLTKVREMEEEDQMYVCLKCCEEESKKMEPEPPNAALTKTDAQQPPPKPQPGPSQTLTPAGVRPVRKVSGATMLCSTILISKLFTFLCLRCVFLLHQLVPPLILIIGSVTAIQRVCCLFTLPLQKVCTWCVVYVFVHISYSVL